MNASRGQLRTQPAAADAAGAGQPSDRSQDLATPAADNPSRAEPPNGPGAGDESRPAELRHQLIAAAAYDRFAARGYVEGQALEDWLAAEALVDGDAQKLGRDPNRADGTADPQ